MSMALSLNTNSEFDPDQVLAYIAAISNNKPVARFITELYLDSYYKWGINPILLLCEAIEETSTPDPKTGVYRPFTSFWANLSNFAGIGVTGATVKADRNHKPAPAPANDWAYDPYAQLWRQGLPNINTTWGVNAHCEHMMAYTLAVKYAANANIFDQRYEFALNYRQTHKFKVITTVEGLAGPNNWAVDTHYAEKIIAKYVSMRNWIIAHSR